ncbi:MAG: hypothetical protein Q7J69_03235 [Candidatus Omnitrophota bacterium]|nr:hypothetical protein [Candidatus Omnitrophota bacterium]
MVRKMLYGFLAVAAVSLPSAGAVFAEDEPRAEFQEISAQPQSRANRQPTAAEMQEIMGPMMGEMMSNMLKAMSKTMAEPQIAQNFATFTRNYYQALTDRGFSEEEALKIVTASGLPSMGGGK